MLASGGELDFVDVVTQPATHADLVQRIARRARRAAVICQKPMAPDMVQVGPDLVPVGRQVHCHREPMHGARVGTRHGCGLPGGKDPVDDT